MVVSSWACSWYVRPSHWTKKVEWFLSCCAALTSCTLITLSRSMNLPWWTCSNIITDHTCNITIQGRISETLRYLSLHTIHVHVLAMDSMIIQHSIVGNFWRVQFLGVFADKDDLSTKIAPLEKFTFYIRQKNLIIMKLFCQNNSTAWGGSHPNTTCSLGHTYEKHTKRAEPARPVSSPREVSCLLINTTHLLTRAHLWELYKTQSHKDQCL